MEPFLLRCLAQVRERPVISLAPCVLFHAFTVEPVDIHQTAPARDEVNEQLECDLIPRLLFGLRLRRELRLIPGLVLTRLGVLFPWQLADYAGVDVIPVLVLA